MLLVRELDWIGETHFLETIRIWIICVRFKFINFYFIDLYFSRPMIWVPSCSHDIMSWIEQSAGIGQYWHVSHGLLLSIHPHIREKLVNWAL